MVTPLSGYIQAITQTPSNAPADTGALASALTSALNASLPTGESITVTDKSAGGNVDLSFAITDIRNSVAVGLSMGSNTNVGLTFPSDVQGTAQLAVGSFAFETIIAPASHILTDSAVQAAGSLDLIDNFGLTNVAADMTVTASVTIPTGHQIDAGLLTLDTTAPSTLGYSGSMTVNFASSLSGTALNTDASLGAAGSYGFLNGLANVSVTADPSVSFFIPVKLDSLDMTVPGLGAGFIGSIGLTGNVFDGNWSTTVGGAGLSTTVLHDFAALSPEKIASEIQSLDTYFSNLTGSSLTNVTIPFTAGTTIGQVLDFAKNFQTDVVDKLLPVNDLLGFSQGQSVTAADGSHTAELVITPTADLSANVLPATFSIDVTANGHTATLTLSNQFTDASGNQHTVSSVNDLVAEINQELTSAQAGSALAALAAALTVAPVSSNTETLGVSGSTVNVGGKVTGGDVVQLTIANTKGLSNGPVTVSVTATTADTAATITTALANEINDNSTLKAAGITASAASQALTVTTASASGTTTLSVPDNAIDFSGVATGNDATPSALVLTAPAASFSTLAGLASNLGQALGLGSDLTAVSNYLSGLGFSYDPTHNAIEFNLNYSTSVSLGSSPTETMSVAGTTVSLGGSVTAGDTLNVTIENPNVTNDSTTISYVVQSGDTLDVITGNLIKAINANPAISSAGLQAAAGTDADTITISHTSPTDTTAITPTAAVSGAISFAAGFNLGDLASLSGSGQLGITASIAASMTVGFNLDPLGAQANGVQMTVDGQPIGVATNIFHAPVWTLGTATTPIASITADQLNGTTGLPDMQLTLRDGTTGTIEVQHGQIIDTIGGGQPIAVAGSGTDNTTLNIQGAVGAKETVSVTVDYGAGSQSTETVTYTTQSTDTPSSVATGLAAAINADAALHKADITAGAAANTLALYGAATLTAPSSTGAETFDQHVVTIGDLLTAFNDFHTGNIAVTVSGVPNTGTQMVTLGGSATAGDVISLVITAPSLGNPVVVSYQMGATDTLADAAQAIAGLIDNPAANPRLATANIIATYTSGNGFTLSGGATITTDPHTLTLSAQSEGNLTVSGIVTPGDIVTINVHGGGLGAATEVVSYTVLHGDTLASIAAGLQAAINNDTVLAAAGVSADIAAGSPDSVQINGGASASFNFYSSAITADGSGNLTLNGTPTSGRVLALSVTPDGGGAAQTAAYTVRAGDTAATDIAKLADAINVVDPTVNAVIKAIVSGADSISVANDRFLTDTGSAITLGVSPLPGDVLDLVVNGQKLNVTVRQGYSTPQDIMASIVDAINAAAINGVSASLSAEITGASLGTVVAPTENLAYVTAPTYDVTASGTPQAGDILSITATPPVASGDPTLVAATVVTADQTEADALAKLADSVNSQNNASVSASVFGTVSGGTLSQGANTTDTGASIDVSSFTAGTTYSVKVDGQTVSYTTHATDTSTEDVIAGLIDAINTANINGATARLTLTLAGAATVSSTASPTETVGVTHVASTTTAVGTGDVLSLTFESTKLSAPVSISYTVQSTDTLATIAKAIATQIDDTTQSASQMLHDAGITATWSTSTPDQILLTGNPSVTTNPASVTLSVNSSGGIIVDGTPAAGDVLAIGVTPTGRTTPLTASYVAQAGDTQANMIAGVADALQTVDPAVTATVHGTVNGVDNLSVWSNSTDNTTDLRVTSGGITVLGAATGDALSLNVNGREIDYQVGKSHSAQDVIAGLVDAINTAGISGVNASLSVDVTGAALSIPSPAGEKLTVTPGADGMTAIYNLSNMAIQLFDGTASNGTTPASLGFVNGTTGTAEQLSVKPASVPSALQASAYYQAMVVAAPTTPVDYTAANTFLLALGSLAPIEVSVAANSTRTTAAGFADAINTVLAGLNLNPTSIGLAPGVTINLASGATTGHVGDTVTLDIHNSSLSGGQETVSYTVQSGDDAAKIATGLATAVNADTTLQGAGITANANAATVSVDTALGTSAVSGSASSLAETLAAATLPYSDLITAQGQAFTVNGAATAGNLINLQVNDNGTTSTVSYTVVSGDTDASIAKALAAKISGITDLAATSTGSTVIFSSVAGNTVAVTNQSSGGNTEFLISSLVFATTMFNEVSASATNPAEAQAASFGLAITPVDTTLSALNGSGLLKQLGFGGTDIGSLTNPVGEIDSGSLYSTTLADRFYFNNMAVVADLSLTLSNLDLQGSIGFIGFDATGHGSLELEAALRMQSPDGNGYVTFHELGNAYGADALSSFFSFTVGAPTPGQPWAQLSVDSVTLTGGSEAGQVIADLTNALVQPNIAIVFDSPLNSISDFIHAAPHVTVTGFSNISEMKHLTAADILAGLQTVLQVISNDTGAQILDAQIPIIGVSIGSLLNYAQGFNSFLTNLQSDPAGSVAQLNTIIQEALGPLGKDVTLSYSSTGALMLGLTFQDNVTQTLPFSLDLATLAADAGITLPSQITDIVSASGSGNLTVTAGAVLGVSLGIQLQAPAATPTTPLADVNSGKGIVTNGTSAPDIVITTGGGQQFGVDLNAIKTTVTAAADNTAHTITIGGTATEGETVSVTLDATTLDNHKAAGSGAVTLTYTVHAGDTPADIANAISQAISGSDILKGASVTATVSGGVVTVAGATSITSNVGGNVQELIDVINAAATAAGAGPNFASLANGAIVFTDSATSAAPTQNAEALGFTPSVDVTGATTVTAAATGGLITAVANDHVTVSGTPTAGEVVTVTVNGHDAAYTVIAGDRLTDIDQHLTDTVNLLTLNGVAATLGGQTATAEPDGAATLGGRVTTGDTVNLTVTYNGSQTEVVSYTATATDTPATEARALAAAVNADAKLQAAHVTAVATGDAIIATGASAALTGTASAASGAATETITAGGLMLVASGAPASITSGDTINLIINGQTEALVVGADAARTTIADLTTAINEALAITNVDGGIVASAQAGTQVALSTLVAAVVDGNGVDLVAADSTLGATPSLVVASPPVQPLGIEALGFTGTTVGTDTAGTTTLTATLPGTIDYTKAYEFQLVVNTVAETISLAADPTRTTDTAFFKALNVALGSTFIDQTAANLGANGKALLGSLLQVSETTSGTGSTATHSIVFTASDSRLGTSHGLSIQNLVTTTPSTLTISDIGGGTAAESLGFAAANQTVSAAQGLSRVLTATALTDNAANHKFFIDTANTGLTISLGASVSNLTFDTNIGPLAISIQNGFAALGAEALVNGALPAAGNTAFVVSTDVANDPGTLHFGLTDGVTLNEKNDTLATAGRLYFSEINVVSQEQTVRVGGAPTVGDEISVSISNAKLSAAETVSYTVAKGDTVDTIGAALAAAVNKDTTLKGAGITAANDSGGTFQIYGATKITSADTGVTTGTTTAAATENVHIATGYGNLLQTTSNIALQVSLPIYFLGVPLSPVISIEIGNVLGGPGGWTLDANPWTLSIPNLTDLTSQLAGSFNLFSFLNSPEAVINGISGLLGTLDVLFTQQVFGYQLPLIGPALGNAGDFIGAVRATLVGDLTGLVNDYKTAHAGAEPTTADIVQSGVNEMLASLGFNGGIVVTVDAPHKTIDFVLDMSKVLFDGTVNLSGSLGIPGLGISVQNGTVGLELDTTIHLAFDYVQGTGFSLMDSMAAQHAVALNFAVTIPQTFSVGLTLGILTMTGTNGTNVFTNADNSTSVGSTLLGGVFVDLHPKSNNDLADLGATTTIVASTDANGTQTVSLTMPSNVDVAAAYRFDVVINGTAVLVSVAADAQRTTEADLTTAINAALGQATIATSVVDPKAAPGVTESLSTLGVSASVTNHVLNFAVSDGALGTSGTLALQDVPIAFSKVGQNLRVEIAANFDLDLALQATLFGGNMALPSVSTEMLFAYQFDKVLVGTDVNAVSGVVMPFTFKDVTLDLGSFLSGFLYPILSSAEKIIQPIMPILNFVTSPLPGISTLLGHPISLLDLAGLFAQGNPKYAKDIATVVNVINVVDEVSTLINTIYALSTANGGKVEMNFGTFTFGKATVGPLAASSPAGGGTSAGGGSFDPFGGDTLKGYQLNTSSISSVQPTVAGSNPKTSAALGQLNNVESGGGISLTILHDPLDALQLLMGQTTSPVTLFQWSLPTVSLSYSFQKEFPIASIGIISLNGIIGVSASLTVHVVIGYDTYGITEFVKTHNPVFILDGFYVDDTQGPQLTASVALTLGVSVSIPIAEVGITATIGGDLSLTLYDASGTGRVRASAILSELETGDPLNLFVVSGDIYAQVDVFVWVGFQIDLGIFGTIRITLFSWDDTLVKATLVSFVLTPPQHPILGTEASDGTVTLNTGELSAQRVVGNTSPNSQDFTLSSNGPGSLTIDFNGSSQTLTGVTKVVADTGDGNSTLTLHDLTLPISISGGAGNNFVDAGGSTDGVFTFGGGNNTIIGTNASDTITVGDGNNVIIDGTGGNTITAGNGNNYIASGSGNDTILVGNGNNVIGGGGGNNLITTGNGNDIVIGGMATTVMTTIVNSGNTYNVYGPNGSGIVSNTSAAGDGSNTIRLGTGNNIVLGGSGSDTIVLNGAGDNFIDAHIGSVTLAGGGGTGALSDWQANGPAAVMTIAATTATGGNDLVDGRAAFGDNVILGGGGNNTLYGGAGTNIILGADGSVDGPAGGTGGHFTISATPTASGNDTIVAGPTGDVLIGGPGNDSILGGAGNDLIAGGDATVVRTAAMGTSANLIIMTAVADGSSGSDWINGGGGNNVIIGGGGPTTIDGGSGSNILLGDYGTVDASSGTNVIVTGAVDTVGNGDGSDTITAGDGNNLIMGGGGNDLLSAGNGNNVFYGDAGQATLLASNYSVITAHTTTESGGGNDTIVISGSGNNIAFGGIGNNAISVTGTGNNVVLGGLGSLNYAGSILTVAAHDATSDTNSTSYPATNVITIGASASGSNVVMGGAGANIITVAASGNNVVLGHAGTATLTVGNGGSLTPTYVTTQDGLPSGEESIGANVSISITGSGNNVVMGGAGDNSITVTGTGDNIVLGALGIATFSGGSEVIQAHDAASDTGNALYPGNDVITVGGPGNGSNVVMGGPGNNTIAVTADGNNVVLGHAGSATLTVGSGGALTPVYVTTQDGLSSGEESIGGNDSISISGNGNNEVMGGAGDNSITVTGTGNNIVLGGLGNATATPGQLVVTSHDAASDTGNTNYNNTDIVTVGAGASGSNVVMGGAGGDTITINANGNNVVLGHAGVATLTVGSGGAFTPLLVTTRDQLSGGEESIGANDTISIAGNGNNVVMGGAGDNSITVTGTGDNIVLGALGTATFSGGSEVIQAHDAASDTGNALYPGNDVITVGGAGNGGNVVMGGPGNNTIAVTADGNNVVLGHAGSATLTVGSGGALTPVYVTTQDGLPSGEESIGGDDSISIAGNGNNVVMGGAGDNSITVTGTGNNIVLGALGSATFSAGSEVVQSHDVASDTGNALYPSNDVITVGGPGNGSNIVMGGSGNDTIAVTANGNNIVLGDSGVATITTAAGGAFLPQYVSTEDTIAGGEESIGGNDTITVTGDGNNAILGGAGADSITVNGTGNNIVLGDLGSITVNGTGNNIVLGDLGSITLGATMVINGHDAASDTGNSGYTSNNTITLGPQGSGVAVVMGGAGANLITQNGSGVAYILGHNGQAIFNNWFIAPVLQLLTTVTTINGGEEGIGGNNTIAIDGAGNNVVMGGAGNNIITASGSGNNALLGHLGQLTPVTVDGIAGYDLLGHNTALGNASAAWNDVITLLAGASGHNTIMGGAGNNTITVLAAGNYTHSGDNVIFAASGEVNPVMAQTVDQPYGGNDTITVGALAGGDNTIFGGVGNDLITIAGGGDNSVFGNMGLAIAVNGSTPDLIGRDTSIGGNDTIAIAQGANGNNVVMGEAGSNVITSSGTGLNVLLGHTASVTHQQIADRLYPELVQSTDFGIGGNNTITATEGNNVIIGGVGNNTLTGGTSNDYIIGHDGNVQFDSNVATTRAPVTMYSTAFQDGGNNVIHTGDGSQSYAIGGTGSSTIIGGAGNDLMAGGQAAITWNSDGSRSSFVTVDTSPVTSSDNTIIGNGGNNDILGSEGGNDTLIGGPGSNIIIGHGGQVFFQDNTEVVAQTINVFSITPDTIIGGGEGHNFLFGGGTFGNQFNADPLSDMIFDTSGRVVITSHRTGEWSMPPFVGNPVTSMVGNWLPDVSEGYVAGVGIIVANEYYTETAKIDRLVGIEMAKPPAGATPIIPLSPVPSAPEMTPDSVLLGDFMQASPDGVTYGGAASAAFVLTDDGGPTLDAAHLDSGGDGAGETNALAYIFDSNSGFWIVDETGPDAITLDLTENVAPLPTPVWWDGKRMAA
ncbi:MAG TPA: hypothetical protein DDZ81_24575 [Acetobacteraceae bacterium]|nr:hypothetical protein [Acetobacteraceae bacterium]